MRRVAYTTLMLLTTMSSALADGEAPQGRIASEYAKYLPAPQYKPSDSKRREQDMQVLVWLIERYQNQPIQKFLADYSGYHPSAYQPANSQNFEHYPAPGGKPDLKVYVWNPGPKAERALRTADGFNQLETQRDTVDPKRLEGYPDVAYSSCAVAALVENGTIRAFQVTSNTQDLRGSFLCNSIFLKGEVP
jgi:hypothetical protein